MELQLEELQVNNAVEELQAAAPAERPVTAKPFRRPLPEYLSRKIHTHMPSHGACPDCSGKLRELGNDLAEMLERVRTCFKIIHHVRPKLSCDTCDRIVQASAPSRPIDRGLAGPALLAHVLVHHGKWNSSSPAGARIGWMPGGYGRGGVLLCWYHRGADLSSGSAEWQGSHRQADRLQCCPDPKMPCWPTQALPQKSLGPLSALRTRHLWVGRRTERARDHEPDPIQIGRDDASIHSEDLTVFEQRRRPGSRFLRLKTAGAAGRTENEEEE